MIEAAFTEDAFRAEIAMKDAPFEETGPDGVTRLLGTPLVTTDTTFVEAPLRSDGIHRRSSGQRPGGRGRMYREGAAWRMEGEGGPPPAGATLVQVQSTTLADASILRGRPGGTGALTPRGRGLEIHPLTDPNAIDASEATGFGILHDGRLLAATEVTMFREAGL